MKREQLSLRIHTAKRAFVLFLTVMLITTAKAQFVFTTNSGTITVTSYTGSGGVVVIPDTINGYPVVSIGNSAFQNKSTVTGVLIPNSVVSIGTNAFNSCTGLTNITIGESVATIGRGAFQACAKLASVTIGANVSSIGSYAFGGTMLTNVLIPSGVISIGDGAFSHCLSLATISIPETVASIGSRAFESCASLNAITVESLNGFYCSVAGVLFNKSQTMLIQYPSLKEGSHYTAPKTVTNIGDFAFLSCVNLKGVYFQDAPPGLGLVVFNGTYNVTVYYLPGTTGWGATYGGRPAVLWNPVAQTSNGNFGVQSNQFGFSIAGSTNIPLAIEACTSLASPNWVPLQNCTLTNGSIYFTDPEYLNYPDRFYRIRSP